MLLCGAAGVTLGLSGLLVHAVSAAGPLVALALFRASLRDGGVRRGLAQGLLFGALANGVALAFLAPTANRFSDVGLAGGVAAVALAALAQAVPYGLAGAAIAAAGTSPDTRDFAFAAALPLTAFALGLFPWTPVVPLTRLPIAAQLAAFVGERGLFLVVAAVAVLVAGAARRPARGVAAAALVAALLGLGALRVRAVEAARARAPRAEIALVDGEVDARGRWAPGVEGALLEALRGATQRTPATRLVVWPEAAYPHLLPRGGAKVRPLAGTAAEGLPLLTGVFLRGDGARRNAALLVGADGAPLGTTEKRHLVLFGEYVPLADRSPALKRRFARGLGIEPGGPAETLVVGGIRAGVLLCLEDTLPEAGREVAEKNPNLLVNITNDAWFTGTAEPELHLAAATFRALEGGRDLVRAVNGGIAAHVSATGERLATRSAGAGPGTLLADAALLEDAPVYPRVGDGPTVALAAIAAALAVWRRRRETKHEGAPVEPTPHRREPGARRPRSLRALRGRRP